MNPFRLVLPFLFALLISVFALAQQEPWDRPTTRPPGENNTRLPSGRLQSDEILKLDHKNNIKDLKQIQELVGDIQTDLEKNDRHVLSIGNLKKLEEVEKLSQRIRGRMKRW